ncbi:response regulator [Azospirillum sp. A39]|uniref:response regulator n=1 Tax=Azospirillum sp. A39 TaxID=3462279 RepID=UPI004045CE8A
MRLLIVEDDPLLGPAMRAVLANAGHDVVALVRGAAKAVRIAARENPDLALIDYHLAGGENGLRLAATLKERHGVPSLLVTAYEHRGQEAYGVALGCLRKPFPPEALAQAVAAAADVLAGRRPRCFPRALLLFGGDTPPEAGADQPPTANANDPSQCGPGRTVRRAG